MKPRHYFAAPGVDFSGARAYSPTVNRLQTAVVDRQKGSTGRLLATFGSDRIRPIMTSQRQPGLTFSRRELITGRQRWPAPSPRRSAADPPANAELRGSDGDLALVNGKFVDGRGVVASSLTIKNGRIVNAAQRLGPDSQTIDLGGRTVIPGLVRFTRALHARGHQSGLRGAANRASVFDRRASGDDRAARRSRCRRESSSPASAAGTIRNSPRRGGRRRRNWMRRRPEHAGLHFRHWRRNRRHHEQSRPGILRRAKA